MIAFEFTPENVVVTCSIADLIVMQSYYHSIWATPDSLGRAVRCYTAQHPHQRYDFLLAQRSDFGTLEELGIPAFLLDHAAAMEHTNLFQRRITRSFPRWKPFP